MSGIDKRLAEAIHGVDPVAESALVADYVDAVAPLVEEARAEGYAQGATEGFARPFADTVHAAYMRGVAAGKDEAAAVAHLGKADA